MNKKGTVVDYMVLLLVVVLIASVSMYLAVVKKATVLERDVGDIQAPILKFDGDIKFYQSFIETAAKQALEKSVPQVAASVGNCRLLNSNTTPKNLNFPSVQKAISSSFNANFNTLLSKYSSVTNYSIPLDNFVVFADKGKLIGAAVKPTKISSENAAAFHRPAFELSFSHGFENYPIVFDKLQVIADQCSFSKDVSACVDNYKGNMKVSQSGNVFTFNSPVGSEDACFKLTIPQA